MRLNLRVSVNSPPHSGHFFAAEVLFRNLVGAKPGLAFFAVNQGVGKILHVTGGFPCPRVHQDRRVKTHDVVVELGHFLPPGLGDAVFEFNAHRPVIPGPILAAVNFRRLKHKTTTLRERRDLFHRRFTLVFS